MQVTAHCSNSVLDTIVNPTLKGDDSDESSIRQKISF